MFFLMSVHHVQTCYKLFKLIFTCVPIGRAGTVIIIYVCVSVCVSVCQVTHKWVDGCWPNLVCMGKGWPSGNAHILMSTWFGIWLTFPLSLTLQDNAFYACLQQNSWMGWRRSSKLSMWGQGISLYDWFNFNSLQLKFNPEKFPAHSNLADLACDTQVCVPSWTQSHLHCCCLLSKSSCFCLLIFH